MAQPQRYASAAQRQAAYRQRRAQARAVLLATPGLAPTPAALGRAREAHWRTLLQQAHRALEQLVMELQECYDARSEPWQESIRGEAFQERIDAVQELFDHCQECASATTPQPTMVSGHP